MDTLKLENRIQAPAAVALGYFDAVHIGHLKVINKAVSLSAENGLVPCAFCFTDDLEMLKRKDGTKDICSKEQRCAFLKNAGVREIIMPDFSEFCSLSPNEFANLLCTRYNAKIICVGEDFKFGKNAAGDAKMLARLSADYGAEVVIEKRQLLDGKEISSTEIKKLILNGDVRSAEKMLGRYYSINEKIVGGKHIGSKELFPTINQKLNTELVCLKNGVYATVTKVLGKIYPSVTDVGTCPTFCKSGDTPVAETHIMDCNMDLYGQTAEVFFLDFLRDEIKFESTALLKQQIQNDIKKAKSICEETVKKWPL